MRVLAPPKISSRMFGIESYTMTIAKFNRVMVLILKRYFEGEDEAERKVGSGVWGWG